MGVRRTRFFNAVRSRLTASHRVLWCVAAWCFVVPGCAPKSATNDSPAEPARTEVTRGPVSLTVEFAPATLRLSDVAALSVTISRDSKLTLEPGTHEDALQAAFVVADFEEQLPRITDDKVVVTHVYRLEPREPGRLTVPPLKYTFKDQEAGETLVVETDPVEVDVTTTLDDDVKLSDLSPGSEPMELPPDRWRYVYWLGSGAGLAVVLLYLMMRKRRAPPPPPPPTPVEVARRELDALRSSGIADRDVKEFYVRLTGIVRSYVEGTTGIRAPEQTTDEFLRETERGQLFSEEEHRHFREFLEAADLVKYAAHTPTPADIETSLDSAEAFVAWEPPSSEDELESAEAAAS